MIALASLKSRLTLTMLAIFILGLWIFAFFASLYLKQDVKQALGNKQLSTVTYIAAEIDQKIRERLHALERVADTIDAKLLKNPIALQEKINNYFLLQGFFNDGVVVFSKEGRSIAITPFQKDRIGINYADRDYLIGALKEGRPTISRPIMGRAVLSPVIVMAVPIINSLGQVIGAVSGVSNLSQHSFLNKITENYYGKTGGYLLVDVKNRLIVTATDQSRIMSPIPARGAIPEVDRLLDEGSGIETYTNPLGQSVLSASKAIPVADWNIISTLPNKEAFSLVDDLLQRLFLVASTLTLATVFLVWQALKRELSPLTSTSQMIARISANEMPLQPLPVARRDEIGLLIEGFNHLTKTLGIRESELRSSEASFRDAFENNHSVMMFLEPTSGQIISANRAASAYYGYSLEQLTGMPITQINPLPADTLRAIRDRAVAHKQDAFLFQHCLASGEVRDVEVYLTPVSRYGKTELFSIVHDVTHRKQAEKQLKALSERLQLATSSAKLGIWDWNIEQETLVWDRQMYSLHGMDESEPLTIEKWKGLIHAEDRERADSEIRSSLEKRGVFDTAYRVIQPSGHIRHIKANGMLVRSKSGQPIRIIGINADITDKKLAEDAQLAANQRLSLHFEQTPLAFVEWDLSFRATRWNPAAESIFGYSSSEALGKHGLFIIPEQEQANASKIIQELLAGGEVRQYRRPNLRKDGTIIDCEWYGSPLRDSQGKVVGIITLAQDITEQIAAQKELERHRLDLESIIQERTEELREAKLLAESANRSKSTFLATMSHEIRTPLNGIIGMAHVLQRSKLTPVQEDRLSKIVVSADHLLNIINDILDLSKIEAGKVALEYASFDLDHVLNNIRSIAQERATAKGLKFHIDKSSSINTLYGDPTRLQQVLLNYVSNAIKFTEAGAVTLRVLLLKDLGSSVSMRFEIIDTGIGISNEALGRLFSPFEQAEHSTAQKYGGTGLGLAICKRIAELMGGEVGASSTVGQGSTFWMSVQLPKHERRNSQRQAAEMSAENLLKLHCSNRSVLVVDDEPINIEIARQYLEDTGIFVDIATDGHQAVVKADQKPYDMILMDMRMPNLCGIEATRRIRKLDNYGNTPIIAITANAFNEDRAQCYEAGMNDFISKPYSPDLLYSKVLQWLTSSNQDTPERGLLM